MSLGGIAEGKNKMSVRLGFSLERRRNAFENLMLRFRRHFCKAQHLHLQLNDFETSTVAPVANLQGRPGVVPELQLIFRPQGSDPTG